MRIALITPYGREHRNGNWHTAARWARFLREAGHTVRTQVEWDGRSTDLMLALHARGIDELPAHLAARTRVVYQSSPDIARLPAPAHTFEVLVIGNLREEKDPFRAALATAYLPEHSHIQVTHLGSALSGEMAETAEMAQRKLPRWHWAGEGPH